MKTFNKTFSALIIFTCFLFSSSIVEADHDVKLYLDNFENNNVQNVKHSPIDTLTVDLGITKFYLGPGEITVFDFGYDQPSAAIFRGDARIVYTPHDEIERYQLKRFTGKEKFDKKLDSLSLFFTDDKLFDLGSISLDEIPIEKDIWEQFRSAQNHAFSNLGIYLPNKLLGKLLMGCDTQYFYADLYVKNMGRFVYRVDPRRPDTHSLFELIMSRGKETHDVISCWTPDPWLISERGTIPIDITNYDIESNIYENGDMHVKCRIYYSANVSGMKFLYFNWYKKNRITSAVDSNGDSLLVIEKKEPFTVLVNQHLESGFGLVLKNPLVCGVSDFVDIEYECNCLINSQGFFYVIGNTTWYPMNMMRDPATFSLIYNYPIGYRVVSSGEKHWDLLTSLGVGSMWSLDYPVCNISFNIGKYFDMGLFFDDLPPIEVFTHMPVHVPQVGADMVNSLAYFTDLLGPCPFDTVKVADNPGGSAGSSPGLENLTWNDLIENTTEGPKRMANQWWKHTLRHESYKDAWITEGLSNYCSFMFFKKSSRRDLVGEGFMNDWRKMIFYGYGAGSKGSEAGPVILGTRLNSSKSKDYGAVVGYKAAYIFHMIRYMLHDFKTDTDSIFVGILRDLLSSYSEKPITSERFQTFLEQHLGNMSWFFKQWVYGISIPEYHFSYNVSQDDDGQYRVTCHVEQKNVPDDFMMPIPVGVYFDGGRKIILRIRVDKSEQDIQLPPLPLKPKKIDFNTYDAVLCRVKYK